MLVVRMQVMLPYTEYMPLPNRVGVICRNDALVVVAAKSGIGVSGCTYKTMNDIAGSVFHSNTATSGTRVALTPISSICMAVSFTVAGMPSPSISHSSPLSNVQISAKLNGIDTFVTLCPVFLNFCITLVTSPLVHAAVPCTDDVPGGHCVHLDAPVWE